MKVTKKTKNVSSNITLDDYDRLMKIARREGKATPKLLRIAIDKLFQKYTVWDTLQKLLTSENTGNIPLPVIEALILAVQKGFETTEKKYREAEQRNPKLKKLTKKTLDGLGNTKPKTERVSGSLNKESNQEVPHVHVHIVPRFNNDSEGSRWPSRKIVLEEELNNTATKIQKYVESISL